MEEKHRKALPGAVDISIEKGEHDTGYKGGVYFDNTDVLVEALAVMMQRAADILGVPPLAVNVKVGELLIPPEDREDEADG